MHKESMVVSHLMDIVRVRVRSATNSGMNLRK